MPTSARVRARRLPAAAEAALLLTAASLVAPVLGRGASVRLLGAPQPPDDAGPRPPLPALQVGRTVRRVAGVLPWRPRCLPQALAVRWMLRRRGIACQSHLGVVSVAPFGAHAWVTVGGSVVAGGPAVRATRLATYG